MAFWNESAIALEKLDDHLKSLLRLKIREFVHLSPFFKNLPMVEHSSELAHRQPLVSVRHALTTAIARTTTGYALAGKRQPQFLKACPHRRSSRKSRCQKSRLLARRALMSR